MKQQIELFKGILLINPEYVTGSLLNIAQPLRENNNFQMSSMTTVLTVNRFELN